MNAVRRRLIPRIRSMESSRNVTFITDWFCVNVTDWESLLMPNASTGYAKATNVMVVITAHSRRYFTEVPPLWFSNNHL